MHIHKHQFFNFLFELVLTLTGSLTNKFIKFFDMHSFYIFKMIIHLFKIELQHKLN